MKNEANKKTNQQENYQNRSLFGDFVRGIYKKPARKSKEIEAGVILLGGENKRMQNEPYLSLVDKKQYLPVYSRENGKFERVPLFWLDMKKMLDLGIKEIFLFTYGETKEEQEKLTKFFIKKNKEIGKNLEINIIDLNLEIVKKIKEFDEGEENKAGNITINIVIEKEKTLPFFLLKKPFFLVYGDEVIISDIKNFKNAKKFAECEFKKGIEHVEIVVKKQTCISSDPSSIKEVPFDKINRWAKDESIVTEKGRKKEFEIRKEGRSEDAKGYGGADVYIYTGFLFVKDPSILKSFENLKDTNQLKIDELPNGAVYPIDAEAFINVNTRSDLDRLQEVVNKNENCRKIKN